MNLTVNNRIASTPVQQATPTKATVDQSKLTIAESAKLGQDTVEIRKGILPTLKGAGAGVLAGGVLAGAGTYALASAFGDEYASLAIVMGGGLGAIAGGVTGAVVANVTDNKTKASAYGALVGGGVGLALGAAMGDLKSALTWAALGAGAGVGGAFAGSAVANRK